MPERIARAIRKTKPSGFNMVQWLALIAGILVGLVAASTWSFWPQIREAALDPRTPFQTAKPFPAPDYGRPEAWAVRAAGAGPVDIFFVHPTTYEGRHWNAGIDNEDAASRVARLMIPNYAGPFEPLGRVFAPRYRQASLYTQITLREDARDARAFAYRDVKAAFDHYLASDNAGRPLIIVGVEQGALLASRLSTEALVQHPDMKGRLVAVYLLETAEPTSLHGPGSALPACTKRDQSGCVVAYLANIPGEDRLLRERLKHAPLWSGDRLIPMAKAPVLCVNPLLGAASEALAPTDANLGAANASGLEFGVQPGPQARQVSAQCMNGVLQVSKPRSGSLRGRQGWTGAVRARPYNWFYADLTADARARLAALTPPAPSPPVSSRTVR
ncbi:MAG: DUF3089 domain-containing protein [Alphaproteobacteria bacterium]